MAFALKSAAGKAVAARRSVGQKNVVAVPRSTVRAAAGNPNRPMWFPGQPAPAHLDGTLPGDTGFDPLNLGSEPEMLKWFVQAELQNARWAMLGVAGILFTSLGAQAGITMPGGLPLPQWYDAGKVVGDASPVPFATLLITQFVMFHWVETKRGYDIRNPGSQGDGSFFGITDDFKGKEVGYPGGRYFDPFGMADGPLYAKYKQNEITNGRLAMTAFVGFFAQHAATGKGPIENLLDHLANPTGVTFATNGVSVPFL